MSANPPRKRSRILVPASKDDFKTAGAEIVKRDPEGRSEAVFERCWIGFFGVELAVVLAVWSLLAIQAEDEDKRFRDAKPCHLLWGLLFLKKYGDKDEMASLCGNDKAVDEKTFRKWAHLFIERISLLIFDVVSGTHKLLCRLCLPWLHNAEPSNNALIFFAQIVWENRKGGDIGNDCLVSVDGTDCSIL